LAYKSNILNIGANYYYRKFHENVSYSKIAEDDVQYQGYLFKGLWFGLIDSWTQDALILSRPFTDVINGGSVQLELVLDKLRFFNEITYKSQEGLTGPGADRAYSQSETKIYEYSGKLQYEQEQMRHYFNVNAKYSDAVNYDKITTQENIGGIYVTFYYGLNKTFTKRNFDFNAEYEIAFGKFKCNPSFDIKAGYHYFSQSAMSSLISPFYFTQDFMINSGYVKANKNFLFNKGMIDLSLMGAYSQGSGDKMSQHVSATSLGNVSEELIPAQSTMLLNREYEYLVSGRFSGEIGMRYSRFVSINKNGGSLYLDAKYGFTKATSDLVYMPGNKSGIFSLTLGYSF
jgi:hypothetical protein